MIDFLNKKIDALITEISTNNKAIYDLQVKNEDNRQRLKILYETRAEYFRESKEKPIMQHEAITKIHDAQKQAIQNIESKIIDFVRTKYIKRHQYYSIKETKLIEWLNNNSLTIYDFKKALEKVFTLNYRNNANGKFYIIREK